MKCLFYVEVIVETLSDFIDDVCEWRGYVELCRRNDEIFKGKMTEAFLKDFFEHFT